MHILSPAPRGNLAFDAETSTQVVAERLLECLADGLDHPELWPRLPDLIDMHPALLATLGLKVDATEDPNERLSARVLAAVGQARTSDLAELIESLAAHHAINSRSPLLQGAMFYLGGLLEPDNPKYTLSGRICREPFSHLDVGDREASLCCSSWLPVSLGDPIVESKDDLWNSDLAQAIRASVHDGSYRYCNKIVCPAIQKGVLPTAERLSAESLTWRSIIDEQTTYLANGPELVNLAYDRTCNLSCPSCRSEPIAADAALRAQFSEMQERTILPLLQNAKTVVVTGSGDPFASKNFRQLMRDLNQETYPDLRFHIMTNGMLLTPRQWDSFPSLHGRVAELKISVDAAQGPTHELLRRGSRWPVMLKNMAFAGELRAKGSVERFELTFVVQVDNYMEMGDAVDLAHRVGADGVYFARLQNWGEFTHEHYRDKAVFLPSHPDYDSFLSHMQDPRLRDPIVWLGNLQLFADQVVPTCVDLSP